MTTRLRIGSARALTALGIVCAAACSADLPGGTYTDPATGGSNASGGSPTSGGFAGAAGISSTGGAAGISSTGGAAGISSTGGAAGISSTGGAAGISSTGGVAGIAGASAGGGSGDGGASGSAAGVGGAGQGGVAGAAGGSAGSAGSAGSGGTGNCMTPPAPSPLVGWASVNGMNQNGTTGGGAATPVVVTSTSAFNSAAAGSNPAVIHVSGSLSGNFSIGSNKTVIGVCGAVLQGHVGVSGSVNVIVRNIKIVGNNCSDSPNDCSGGADAVSISNGAHHVWFDHTDISDGSDGNLDINAGSDFVTISWTKFSYSSMRTDPEQGSSGHRFSNLIGSGDNVTSDRDHLNVTFHHVWWAQNINQRMPRTRFGDIHVFNNLYTASGNSYCTNAGIETRVLVQNNVYIGVNNPLSPDANGNMLASGNLFTNTNPANPMANGSGFVPPYQYTLEATGNLAATIQAQAGPH